MISNTKIYLTGGDSGSNVTGLSNEKNMFDLLSSSSTNIIDNIAKSKKKSIKKQEFDIMEMSMLLKKSHSRNENSFKTNTLRTIYTSMYLISSVIIVLSILSFTFPDKTMYKIPLQVDALSMLHIETKLTLLYDILVESICRYLRLVEQNLIQELVYIEKNELSRDFGIPKCYHFMHAMGHFLTQVYPVNIPDDDEFLLSKRLEMSKNLGLTEKRPNFRKAAIYKFRLDIGRKILINPHVGLKSQGII